MTWAGLAMTAAGLLLSGAAARADVDISSKPTANMNCDSGVCTATAQKAVLNAGDLQTMLASGDVAVKTGSIANNIDIDQPLTWSSTSRLTLDARQSVTVKKQVTVSGTGNLTIVTNDGGGKKGEFVIVPEHGSVQFWDLASSLMIDGNAYTLVGDIKTLANDIAANPSGFYALAKPYDASVDGTYAGPAIPGEFPGMFEGLGNTVSNFSMTPTTQAANVNGFFQELTSQGILRNFGLQAVKISGNENAVGTVSGGNEGKIDGCWATGSLSTLNGADGGGLLVVNGGTISRSFSRVNVTGESPRYAGGLAAVNAALIIQSYATGMVKTYNGLVSDAGGLVGFNADGEGQIVDSYALGTLHDGRNNCCEFGGLVGKNGVGATITNTFNADRFSKHGRSVMGGLIGEDNAVPGSITNGYWNLDKGISDPAQGAGNIPNDPGIIGLTDAQLKSGLPAGFDPKIWGSDPKINNGYPYLLANPPR